ncbi:uncharacterized protein ACA1_139680 [Acanthamoeba castellanii str. Neff]|uniref:Zinc-finger domain-containing protein n=1 Tax=Acanthamoeba castellanii (strain ATCC 30010 / Neff) TaxID=1257118 RepID=L8GQ30_ACACF|nr:uncharacterized protein ACA1_139680 [Acanthamoeba castellanii str. Neff]ELR14231.1 hypothetical protein ACA1_139680 [Acanthamoeba castellanii str. Neff]
MVVGGEGEEHVDTTAAAVEKEEEEEEKAAMSRLVMRFGVSCHACKVLQPRLWVCPRAPAHRWCAKCLRNRFGVAFAAAPAWPGLATARGCPACRGHCPCAACRRSGGSQPHQNSSGRPRMTTAAAAATEQPQRDGGGGGGTAERRERGFGRLMHEEHHDWTKVLDRDAYRSSLVFRKRFLSEAEGEGLVEVLRGCEDQMRYHRFVVMGKKTEHLEPRATLCFGSTVAYHGVTVVTQPWSKAPPELIALKKKMVDELKVEVNSFLCTRYLNVPSAEAAVGYRWRWAATGRLSTFSESVSMCGELSLLSLGWSLHVVRHHDDC